MYPQGVSQIGNTCAKRTRSTTYGKYIKEIIAINLSKHVCFCKTLLRFRRVSLLVKIFRVILGGNLYLASRQ